MSAVLGAAAGALITGGSLLCLTGLRRVGAPGLARISPYLPPSAIAGVHHTRPPGGAALRALRGFDRRAWVGAGMGAGGALTLGITLVLVGVLPPRGGIALAVLGGMCGLTVAQWRHQRAIEQQRAALIRGLPATLDLLAFCVAAGESPQRGLLRVTELAPPPLAGELAVVGADVESGATFLGALRGWRERSPDTAIGRFIDVIETALERGAPLAEVLRAQAADIRFAVRAAALDRASRQEIGVLIPVVFLVLPSVVLVALYPGLVNLRLVLG
ncbi:MAG: type II secretion system F family protein [Actinomycetales bacterium]|nr:type II secretion system F family protein [Actinomycetales bacterium]